VKTSTPMYLHFESKGFAWFFFFLVILNKFYKIFGRVLLITENPRSQAIWIRDWKIAYLYYKLWVSFILPGLVCPMRYKILTFYHFSQLPYTIIIQSSSPTKFTVTLPCTLVPHWCFLAAEQNQVDATSKLCLIHLVSVH